MKTVWLAGKVESVELNLDLAVGKMRFNLEGVDEAEIYWPRQLQCVVGRSGFSQ